MTQQIPDDPGAPLAVHRFAVEIAVPGSAERLCGAAFAECGGIELSVEALAIHEGGGGQVLLPGARSHGLVTLRRGLTGDLDLWRWAGAFPRGDAGAQGGDLRPDARVTVLAADGVTPRISFLLHRCLPVRLRAPALDARASAVAIEELHLAYESLEVLGPGGASLPAGAGRPLVRAELRRLDASLRREVQPEHDVAVQFNPESLRVTFASPRRRTARSVPPAGAGLARLEVQLWFDATSAAGGEREADVRRLTERVAWFMAPERAGARAGRLVPRAVRFVWGTFQFDGFMESLEETLDLFSRDGRPLRASLRLAIAQDEIRPYAFRGGR